MQIRKGFALFEHVRINHARMVSGASWLSAFVLPLDLDVVLGSHNVFGIDVEPNATPV